MTKSIRIESPFTVKFMGYFFCNRGNDDEQWFSFFGKTLYKERKYEMLLKLKQNQTTHGIGLYSFAPCLMQTHKKFLLFFNSNILFYFKSMLKLQSPDLINSSKFTKIGTNHAIRDLSIVFNFVFKLVSLFYVLRYHEWGHQ